ncbi:hypothetical protein BDQ17DRAFT_1365830 [Cyathus striatus]|nr:hypothetical protein BDQ17DRAFT_1365830 [Cyathus striatus]
MRLQFDPSVPPNEYFTALIQGRYRAQHYWSLAAFVFLVWEYVCTCRYEFSHIWRRPMTTVKVIYLFSRYFGLLFHFINHMIMMKTLSRLPVVSSTCHRWFAFQIVSFAILFSAMEVILMLRVYALYHHSRGIGLTLAILFIIEIAVSVACPLSFLPELKYDVICTGEIAPRQAAVYCSTVVFVQLVVVSLTLAKRNSGLITTDTEIVRLVHRDGVWVFAVVLAIMSIMMPYSIVEQTVVPYIIFSWPISIFSLITCRVIMNLQRLKVEPSDHLPQRYTGQSPSEIELPPILGSNNRELADLNL